MKKIFSNYRQTIILIMSLIIGSIVGIIFKEKTQILKPLGDLFMNMMFVIIVPLIFLTITTSISKITQPKRLGKVLSSIIIVFIVTSLVAVFIGIISTYSFKLVNPSDSMKIKEVMSETTIEGEKLNILERTVSAISVTDFSLLLSKNSILALVIFSIFVGIAINKLGDSAKAFKEFLESANKVINKVLEFAFLYAPIGLGCYFAALIGTFGNEIAVGYLKKFIIYLIVSILFYIIVYSIYAFIAAGKKGVISYWKNIIPATATSIATCSSAASIPVNMSCTKKIGVPNDIAETTIPLGTSFHKDGSLIGSVFKIMFLAYLFGTNVTSIDGMSKVIITALIANLLIVAVPVGGGTISEMMIITLMGFPTASLPILTIIATIIDAPATMLNVVGDTASSMLITKMVNVPKWLKFKKV